MFKFFFRILFIFIIICFWEKTYAQNIDTTQKSPSEFIKTDTAIRILSKNDSSITSMAIEDSAIIKVMEMDSALTDDFLPSEFIFRIDYFNKTLSAGRDLGVNQFSVIPSITYYHKTGFYTGLSGSWYSETFPNYSLTDLTAGYSNLLGKSGNFSYSLSYDHFLFNPSDGGVLTNALGIYGNYDFGPVNVGLNYSYLFGNKETGNKLSPSVGAYFKIKNVGFIDKITIMPSISVTFGSGNLPFSVFNKKTYKNDSTIFDGVDVSRLFSEQHTFEYYKLRNKYKTLDEDSFIKQEINYLKAHPKLNLVIPNVFGLLSYNLSLPVKFTIGRVKLGITYNYVIPIQLPYQIYHLKNQSYFSANISYLLEMKPRRKKIK